MNGSGAGEPIRAGDRPLLASATGKHLLKYE
jgi:hypothetical protein